MKYKLMTALIVLSALLFTGALAVFTCDTGADTTSEEGGGDEASVIPESEQVSVQIGSETYKTTLVQAVSKVQENESGNKATITFRTDITTTDTTLSFTKEGEYVLDIGAYTWTNTTDGYTISVGGDPSKNPWDGAMLGVELHVKGSGKIIVTNGTVFNCYGTVVYGDADTSPDITYTNTSEKTHSIFMVQPGSKLTINGGTFSFGTGNVVKRVIQSWGETVIKGGTFKEAIELWGYSTFTSSFEIENCTVGYLNTYEYSETEGDKEGEAGTNKLIISNPSGKFSRSYGFKSGSSCELYELQFLKSEKGNGLKSSELKTKTSGDNIYLKSQMVVEKTLNFNTSKRIIAPGDYFTDENLIRINSGGVLSLSAYTVDAGGEVSRHLL